MAYSIVEEVLTKLLADVPWNDNTAALSGATFLPKNTQGEDSVQVYTFMGATQKLDGGKFAPGSTQSDEQWQKSTGTSSTFSTPSRFQPARASS